MSVAKTILCILIILQTGRTVAQAVTKDTGDSDLSQGISYDSVISKASSALNSGNFDVAYKYYKQALKLKPGDTYAFKMLKVVDSSKWAAEQKQAKDTDLKRKAEINILMRDALNAIMEKKYDTARALYSQVLVLNPVRSQKEFIEQKIKALDQALGRPALNAVSTKPAIVQQTQKAVQQTIKKEAPVTTTPVNNIVNADERKPIEAKKPTAIASTTQQQQNVKVEEKVEAPTAQSPPVKQLIANDVSTGKEIAVSGQKDIKDIKVDEDRATSNNTLASNGSKTENDAAKKKSESVEAQIKKAQNEEVNNNQNRAVAERKVSIAESPKTLPTAQQQVKSSSPNTNKNTIVAPTSKPVVDQKNNVVRTQPTADQTVKTSPFVNNERIAEISGKILNGKGRLNLSDSIGSVKLTCQQIVVTDKNAFIKFLIQNNSSSEPFIPGSLKLLYIKNYGVLQKLNGRFVTNTATILPRQEIPLVYVVDAPLEVESNEVFVFEMEEKNKNMRLTINVPGEVYLNEKKVNHL